MPRRAASKSSQMPLLEVNLKTAPCVPAIKEAVRAWVADGYKGATATSKTLLNYWFRADHRLPNGQKFAYHYFQREAVETLIYLYEVAGARRHKTMLETYATAAMQMGGQLRLLQYDDFPRYCVKMATGSGKTKVLSLAIAWQYFNAVLENAAEYAATSLIIAPNVIVYERLNTDFAGGRIFRADPVIPRELKVYWDVECYMRGDAERAGSQGAVYLTNIQQLYERDNGAAKNNEPDIMTAVLGPRPPAQPLQVDGFDKRILARGGPVFVANDEAHHTHDEGSEWNKGIRRLHDALLPKGGVIQLDVSATPRYSKGSLFTWTVFDYPLKQAIIDGVTKRPIKGVARGMAEAPSDIASIRYQAYLVAGVKRWQEYRDQLKSLGRKPVLFVMMNSTRDADDVADFLQKKFPDEFSGDRLLTIHTDREGEVSKDDLALARKASQEIDYGKSPINAIVSVLMLREGWDVQSVTVVVGLRPYSAKANILPEQTIGRGLRLMFRGKPGEPDFRERVDVIGNKAFLEFVEQLERDEDMAFDTVDLDAERVVIERIYFDPEKAAMDIRIPEISPSLERKKSLREEIDALDVAQFKMPKLPKKEGDRAAQDFRYEGYDIITLEKLIERDYTIPAAQTAQEIISFLAKLIAAEIKLPSQFAALAPKVSEFARLYAFGEPVDLDDPAMIKALQHKVALHMIKEVFVNALRKVVVQELTPELRSAGRNLSSAEGFPWGRPTLPASKTVFNLVAAANNFEKGFAAFLQGAPDVARFAKLPESFGFSIAYTDSAANLRYYEPDFVAVTTDGVHHLIETKGREDIDVKHKDRAAMLWCENATLLTDTPWEYIIVHQKKYEDLRPDEFSDLVALAPVGLF